MIKKTAGPVGQTKLYEKLSNVQSGMVCQKIPHFMFRNEIFEKKKRNPTSNRKQD